MTRKSKAKQERYVVGLDGFGACIHGDTNFADKRCWPILRLKDAQARESALSKLTPDGFPPVAIFRLVRVRSKPKSSRGGRK